MLFQCLLGSYQYQNAESIASQVSALIYVTATAYTKSAEGVDVDAEGIRHGYKRTRQSAVVVPIIPEADERLVRLSASDAESEVAWWGITCPIQRLRLILVPVRDMPGFHALHDYFQMLRSFGVHQSAATRATYACDLIFFTLFDSLFFLTVWVPQRMCRA
jgi:hypothetical protein